jgi:hypothetical protein
MCQRSLYVNGSFIFPLIVFKQCIMTSDMLYPAIMHLFLVASRMKILYLCSPLTMEVSLSTGLLEVIVIPVCTLQLLCAEQTCFGQLCTSHEIRESNILLFILWFASWLCS